MSWSERMAAWLRTATLWLGGATLGWSVVLGTELALRTHGVRPQAAVVYLVPLALVASAWWSLAVLAVQAALHLALRYGARALVAACAALGLLAALPAFELSSSLVEGDWISHQPYAFAVQLALFAFLLAAWLGVWLWHAWGTSTRARTKLMALRARAARSIELVWPFGAGALPATFIAIGGPLRPYLPMSEALLFPSWLIVATLAFRVLRALQRPRAVSLAADVVLAVACALLLLRVLDPLRGAPARHAALSAAGFIALTDTRVDPFSDDTLGRFDFAAVDSGACGKPRKLPALALSAAQRRNVILLSIDTMRRDAIGKRIGKRAVAPNLEAFARDSVFFERATSAAPITLYSIGSLLSGHSVNQLIWQRDIPRSVFTQTRRLFDRQTMFLPDWSVMRRDGFDRLVRQRTRAQYIDRKADAAAPFIAALDAVRDKHERAFLWLHLVDAHYPYKAHAGFDFGASKRALYYGEIALDDALLGRVIDHLRERGFFDDSLIIMFSDHGESLGEGGGYWGHGISMLGRFTDVPLYVHVPGAPARSSQAPAMLTQIAPTILHFLDQPIAADIASCSLLASEAELRACPLPVSGVYGIGTETFNRIVSHPLHTIADLRRRQNDLDKWRRFDPEIAVASSEHRYVLNLRSGAEQLYARAHDVKEKRDLAGQRPDLMRTFRARVTDWRREEAQRIVCDVVTNAAE